jgi:hypothetical protein
LKRASGGVIRMITSDIPVTSADPAAAAQITPNNGHGFGFHDLLSALNPLQYLPVVGTIYRAITGDVIPEALREGGSLLASGLMGGPIGLILNITATIAEKITGIDPEKIVSAQFHTTPAAAVVQSQPPKPDPIVTAAIPYALAPEQVAPNGVRADPSEIRNFENVGAADVLNGIELTRLGKVAAAAYAANQPVPFSTVSLTTLATVLPIK